MKRNLIAASIAALSATSVPASAASMMFSLSGVDPSSGVGAGPFGTVTVTESGNSLTFTQTLAPGYRIHDGNATHNAFAFSLVGDPAVTVTNLTNGFQAINLSAGSNVTSPPFGSYFTAIDCTTACGPGYANGFAGTLSFTVSTVAPLTLASLLYNTIGNSNYYFTTDIINANGSTANVGATLTASAVPETATWGMMIAGFGMIGAAMRARRRSTKITFA
jgi:hypothetical protein